MQEYPNIRVSRHAAFIYTKRFLNAPDEQMSGRRKNEIDAIIIDIFKDAVYMSDNFGETKDEDRAAVLLRNNELKMDFLVRNRTIVTLWPVDKDKNKRIRRERKPRYEARRENIKVS